jgi:uncharacterized protein YcsI (UPF0317 family)
MNNTAFCDPDVSNDPVVDNRTMYNCSSKRRGRAFFAQRRVWRARSITAQGSPLAFRIAARHSRVHGQPVAIVLWSNWITELGSTSI